MGFFGANQYLTGPPKSRLPQCGTCGLLKKCQSPKLPVVGSGDRGILIVGDWPTRTDDEDGEVFAGSSGQMVLADLKRMGVKALRDCWITYSMICSPGAKEPTESQLAACYPHLRNTISKLNPRVIILLGTAPVRSLIGDLWRESPGGIEKWAGYQIPSQELNAWVCPVHAPRYVRQVEEKQPVARLWFRKNLERALSLEGRPWPEGPPNYERQIECIVDPKAAAKAIREIIKTGGTTAFDYETDRLKPDSPEARVLAAAICSRGGRTISYLWAGEAIEATSEYLLSPSPKIMANGKFELRWTRAVLGHSIRNFVHDTMLAAHWLDNHEGVTSVKFQAFALLGYGNYSEIAKSLMDGARGNVPNKLDQMDKFQLLKYNGLDAVLEYHIAKRQRQMKVEEFS